LGRAPLPERPPRHGITRGKSVFKSTVLTASGASSTVSSYSISNVIRSHFCRTFFLTTRGQENKRDTQATEDHPVFRHDMEEKISVIRLLSGSFPTQRVRQGGDHQQDEKDEEKNLGHSHGRPGDTGETEKPCDEG
jgi:hypothetical protein